MDSGPGAICNTLAAGLNQEPNVSFCIKKLHLIKFFTILKNIFKSYLMRLLDGLPYPKMPHFWMVFIWAKLIAFQNKIVPNLWILPPKNKPRSMEYFFAVLKDQDQDRLLRAMSAFIIGRDKKGQIRVIQVPDFFSYLSLKS